MEEKVEPPVPEVEPVLAKVGTTITDTAQISPAIFEELFGVKIDESKRSFSTAKFGSSDPHPFLFESLAESYRDEKDRKLEPSLYSEEQVRIKLNQDTRMTRMNKYQTGYKLRSMAVAFE